MVIDALTADAILHIKTCRWIIYARVYVHTDLHQSMAEEEMYSVENLMPACRQCNLYKSTLPLEVFRDRIRSVLWANLKKEFNYRLALKYGLIEEHDVPITFFFENF